MGLVHFTLSAIGIFLDHFVHGVLEGAGHGWLHAVLAVALHHEDIGADTAGLVVGVAEDLDLGQVVSHACG